MEMRFSFTRRFNDGFTRKVIKRKGKVYVVKYKTEKG